MKSALTSSLLFAASLLLPGQAHRDHVFPVRPTDDREACKEAVALSDRIRGGETMPRRSILRGHVLTRTEAEQIMSAAVAMGADPQSVRKHFEGHLAEDEHTRFLIARADPRSNEESDLTLASALNLTEIVANRLAQGDNPNQCALDGTTPLMDAAHHGNQEMVEMLLKAGAKVNTRSQDGSTALLWAASNGRDEVVKMLLTAGAEADPSGLLSAAASRCKPETLRDFLELGLDVNEKGGHPLLSATAARNLQNMTFLLKHGANVNAKGYKARTPLIMATRDDDEFLPANPKLVALLLQYGADVNAKDEEGWTALMGAARDGDSAVVRLLLAKNADARATDSAGDTPLGLALRAGDSEVIQLIEQYLRAD